jgi:hypothetical protein
MNKLEILTEVYQSRGNSMSATMFPRKDNKTAGNVTVSRNSLHA